LDEVETRLHHLDSCWYLDQQPRNRAKYKPSKFIAQFETAIQNAKPHEKPALGLTYASYSESSEGIHFRAEGRRHRANPRLIGSNLGNTGLLVMAIIARIQDLLGTIPQGVNHEIRDMIDRPSPIVAARLKVLTEQLFEPGDMVLTIYGDLGQIVEVNHKDHSYWSYRLRYWSDPPSSAMTVECLPGNFLLQLVPFHTLAELVAHLPFASLALRNTPEAIKFQLFPRVVASLWHETKTKAFGGNQMAAVEALKASLAARLEGSIREEDNT